MAKVIISVDRNCVPVQPTNDLGRTYRSIVIGGRKSGARYHDVLYGQVSTIESRLLYIRNCSTPAEARVADFILRNEGALLEVEF